MVKKFDPTKPVRTRGGLAAAKVAEQPRVQATATKALDALDAWLDKQIEEKKGE